MLRWHSPLSGLAFEGWLRDVARGGRVAQGQPLDPFATSLRNFRLVSSYLDLVMEGRPLPARGGNGGQAGVDLGAMGFVSQAADDTLSLTDLGAETLSRWREMGVASNDHDDEFVRCVSAVKVARDLGSARYQSMMAFWREVRAAFNVPTLVSDPAALYLVSYLNQTCGGFNPWSVIRAVQVQFGDLLGEWVAFAAAISERDPDAGAAATELGTRVRDFGTRGSARQRFCLAMELLVVAEEDPKLMSDALQAWAVPIG